MRFDKWLIKIMMMLLDPVSRGEPQTVAPQGPATAGKKELGATHSPAHLTQGSYKIIFNKTATNLLRQELIQ